MPQSGTGVSVEAVDPVFQTKMMDMLRQTGRYVDGWDVDGEGWMALTLSSFCYLDRRPSSDGIILIRALAVGCQASISTLSSPSNS